MNLRKLAQGKPCYLRFDGCSNPESVVLCHLRIGGIAGIGQKPEDICGLPGCMNCHSILDGRTQTNMLHMEIRAVALRGFVQWLDWLVKNHKITY